MHTRADTALKRLCKPGLKAAVEYENRRLLKPMVVSKLKAKLGLGVAVDSNIEVEAGATLKAIAEANKRPRHRSELLEQRMYTVEAEVLVAKATTLKATQEVKAS